MLCHHCEYRSLNSSTIRLYLLTQTDLSNLAMIQAVFDPITQLYHDYLIHILSHLDLKTQSSLHYYNAQFDL